MDKDWLASYGACDLCPRACGVDRLAGMVGFCGETADCRIGAMVAHGGEEPCIAGQKGSGTIFFSGCSTGCFFCQNHQISQEGIGKIYTLEQLHDRALELLAQGVHNLNFVTPEHWWPHIKALCQMLREEGVDVPFVWNSSGYFTVERLREQAELIDVFLPDFKYATPELAEACMGDPRYPQLALEGIKFLADRVGNLRPFDETGEMTATRGVMVRHLVLPGEVENSLRILDLLAEQVGTDLPLSLMSQFMPVPACHERGMFERGVREEEYCQVYEYAESLGFWKMFVQEGGGDDGFLPDFREEQPFAAMRPAGGTANHPG